SSGRPSEEGTYRDARAERACLLEQTDAAPGASSTSVSHSAAQFRSTRGRIATSSSPASTSSGSIPTPDRDLSQSCSTTPVGQEPGIGPEEDLAGRSHPR